jgi:uncharacterized protein (TIGR02118 family)
MHKMLVLYPPGQDEKKFRPYYETKHVPLANRLPGVLATRYSFDIGSPAGNAPFYCIFEADFADATAMVAATTSEIGKQVREDVSNFATHLPMIVHYEVAK